MSRKLIVFDFDGTIVQSHYMYTQALQAFSEARGLQWDAMKMATGYVDPLRKDLGWGVPLEQQPQLFKELNEFYAHEVRQNKRFLPTLFDGMESVLAELYNHYDLGIVSAQIRTSMLAVLEHYDLVKYFPKYRSICCARDRGYAIKPAPDALECLLRDMDRRAEDTIVIGDSMDDIAMARAAGAKSIAVVWGFYSRDRLEAENPTVVLDTISDLPETIRTLFKR
jgi:phosphoglycolate phosphatase-like HAD superfamily hydrolase